MIMFSHLKNTESRAQRLRLGRDAKRCTKRGGQMWDMSSEQEGYDTCTIHRDAYALVPG